MPLPSRPAPSHRPGRAGRDASRGSLFSACGPGALALLVAVALAGALAAPPTARAQTVSDIDPVRGVADTTLRLHGTGLDGLTTSDVLLGGSVVGSLLGTVESILEPNLLKVQVPTGLQGPVAVQVDGQTAAERFTVVTGGPASFPSGTTVFSDEDNKSSPRTVARGDIDGDGDLDLVVGFGESGEVRWFENDGTGSFGNGRTITSGFNFPRDIVLADVVDDQDASGARDGALDVVVAGGEGSGEEDGSSNDRIRVYPNQRTGPDDVSFGGEDVVQSSPVDDVRSLAAGDIDLDGDVDLVSVSQDNGRVVRHMNDDGTDSFTNQTVETLSDPRTVALADLGGDDRLDVVVAEHSTSGTVLRLDGNGDGTFDASQPLVSDFSLSNPLALDVADLTGNGAPGVVVATESSGDAVAFLNTGSGFSQAQIAGTSGASTTIHAADVSDGDGRPEVIVGNAATGEVTWHSAAGSFGNAQVLTALSGEPTAVATADVDADGDLDPVVLTRSPDRVSVLPNGTAGPQIASFPADTTIDEDTQTAARTFSVSDLDTAEEDLVVTGTSSNPALVPDGNVVVGSDGADSTVTVTPRPDSNGTATITVSVDDGTSTISDSFTLTVDPVNDAPSIDAVADQSGTEDTPLGVSFGASDVETALDASHLSASSSNRDLVRGGDVSFSGPDSDGRFTATIDPRPDSNGTATLTVTVDDDGGRSASTSFGLTVSPVNDAPTLTANAGLSLAPQNTAAITPSQLKADDVDDAPGDITYTVTTLPTQGDLLVGGTALDAGGTFTQQQLADGTVAYAHTGSGDDSFSFEVADDGGALGPTGQTFAISISTTNEPPTLETNAGLTLDEDTESTITSDHLLASDPDDPAADVVFTVASAPVNGTLSVGGTALADGDTFTLRDLNDGAVAYAPAPNYSGADSLTFDLADDQTTSLTGASFSITVTAINDAPTLVTNATLRVEDGQSGTIDSTLLRTTDVEDGPSALQYTVDDPPSHGALRLNGEPVTVGFTQADLNAGRLQYVHDSSTTAADAVAFTVADASGGGLAVSDTFDVAVTVVRLAAERDTVRAGLVPTGQPKTLTVRLTNVGTTDLTELEAQLEDPQVDGATAAPGDFTLDAVPTGPLAPGESARVRVSFVPSAPGRRAAALQLSTSEGALLRPLLTGRGLGLSLRTGVPARNQTTPVELTVEGGAAERDTLYARRGGTEAYRAIPFETVAQGPPLELSALIPDSMATARGIDYYLRLSTPDGTVTVPTAGPRDPQHLTVQFDRLEAPFSLRPERYRMVSVPAAPSDGVKAALEAAYGPYDPNTWRLERWDGRAETYRSYSQLDSLRAGQGFWLVTAGEDGLSLPSGRTVDADTTRRVPLRAGWNQVGTPFGFAVPWDTVRAASGLAPAAVDGPIAYRDSAYRRSARLRPWAGYFVFSAEADTLRIPPVGASSAAKALAAKGAGEPAPAAARYGLRVEAIGRSGRSTATLGLRADARVGRDRYDRAQPPPLGPAPRLGALVRVGDRMVPHAHSARPAERGSAASAGQRWTLRLRRPAAGDEADEARPITLRLESIGDRPDGWTRYVLDERRGTRIASGAALRLAPGETRRLTVIVGTEAYAEQASGDVDLSSLETDLRGSYPNPFADRATIEYVLAEEQTVTLRIYNVLGQRVRTLVEERQSPGVHRVEWDGTNQFGSPVGSGVYFYRLEAGPVTETQKTVHVR